MNSKSGHAYVTFHRIIIVIDFFPLNRGNPYEAAKMKFCILI